MRDQFKSLAKALPAAINFPAVENPIVMLRSDISVPNAKELSECVKGKCSPLIKHICDLKRRGVSIAECTIVS